MPTRPTTDLRPHHLRGDTAIAAALAFCYLIVASIWLLLSDRWLRLALPEPEAVIQASLVNGLGFILATTLGLFIILRRLVRALEQERSRLRALVAAIPDLVWLKDANGAYLNVNRAAERFHGRSESEFLHRTDFDLQPPERAAEYVASDQEAIAAGRPMVFQDRVGTAGDGAIRHFETIKTAVRDSEGALVGVLGIARDVSEREQTLAALRKSEEFNRAVLDSTAAQIAVLDSAGRVIATNAAWRRFGDENPAHDRALARTVIGSDFLENCRSAPAADRDLAAKALDGIEAVITGTAESFAMECRCPCHSPHQHCYCLLRVTPLRSPAGGAVVAFQDITALHRARHAQEQANRQLEALALRHLSIQEEERKALSLELHDHIGQTLTALKIDLAAARLRCADPLGKAAIARSSDIADGLIDTTRDLSLRLRPPLLDDLGLASAVRWYLTNSPMPDTIDVDLYENIGDARYGTEAELASFRIVQESVSNALRHAEATQLSISLAHRSEELHITIRDNGKGFDAAQIFDPSRDLRSLGLLGMRERTAGLGGRFAIDARPGAGTEVTARFPLGAKP